MYWTSLNKSQVWSLKLVPFLVGLRIYQHPLICERKVQSGTWKHSVKTRSKGIPRQAEVALGVPGRLRPRIFSTFGTARMVGRQPNAPAAFTPREFSGTHFQRLSRPQGKWFCRKEPRKNSKVTTPGIDPGTVRLVAQRLNNYGTPGPFVTQSTLHYFPLFINAVKISYIYNI
jgi:hypothetical protein